MQGVIRKFRLAKQFSPAQKANKRVDAGKLTGRVSGGNELQKLLFTHTFQMPRRVKLYGAWRPIHTCFGNTCAKLAFMTQHGNCQSYKRDIQLSRIIGSRCLKRWENGRRRVHI